MRRETRVSTCSRRRTCPPGSSESAAPLPAPPPSSGRGTASPEHAHTHVTIERVVSPTGAIHTCLAVCSQPCGKKTPTTTRVGRVGRTHARTSRWSYSCWKMRACQPSSCMVFFLPLLSWYFTLQRSDRSTLPLILGNDKHPCSRRHTSHPRSTSPHLTRPPSKIDKRGRKAAAAASVRTGHRRQSRLWRRRQHEVGPGHHHPIV